MNERLSRAAIEAASWRLASDLVRRHPRSTRIVHTHPGGGQYDCLTITSPTATGGVIQLNRNGSIQVHQRFAGREEGGWMPVGWHDYLASDRRSFVARLESAAGLPSPRRSPPATATTLTVRVLAELAATAEAADVALEIQAGYIDSSGGGGPNSTLDAFTGIPSSLRDRRPSDLFGQPGYRFWLVQRSGRPILAFEQDQGLAWTVRSSVGVDLLAIYRRSRHDVAVTAFALLRMVDDGWPPWKDPR